MTLEELQYDITRVATAQFGDPTLLQRHITRLCREACYMQREADLEYFHGIAPQPPLVVPSTES